MANEPDVRALVEAWDKGLITRDEFRQRLGYPAEVVTTNRLTINYPMGQLGHSFRMGPEFQGLANDNRDEGF